MDAEIISVGTELLLGQITDTNAVFLSEELAALGINLYFRATVGDNAARLAEALRAALGRSDLVITSGGLGPTMDDLTKETVAEVLGRELVFHPPSLAAIEEYFQRSGRPMPASNRKQALVPMGGRPLPNHHGTAPGILVEEGEKVIICLPGPPRELIPMFREEVLPYLKARQTAREGETVILSRVLKIIGIGESMVEEMVREVMANQSNPTLAPLAGEGEVRLRLTARAASRAEAEGLIAGMEAELRRILGSAVYGVDTETLPAVVGELLVGQGLSLAVAESCTGGLIANLLTDISGSSRYFERGVVSYSNAAKRELLKVPADLLATHGAVSAPVAEAMAEGVRRLAGTDLGLAVTGIAGPGGATSSKPVGLVYLALSGPGASRVEEHRFSGERLMIKRRTALAALNLLRLFLLQRAEKH